MEKTYKEQVFDKLYEKIVTNKEKKENGEITSISSPFSRLNERFPGWEKGVYTIITASSGIGKTKLTKFLIISSVYKFIKENPKAKVKVFYFALEESKEEFWLSLLSSVIYEKYGISLSNADLKSLGSYTISNDLLEKIVECRAIIEELEQFIEVNDHVSNPYGIYKTVRTYFEDESIGHHITKKINNEDINIGYTYKDDNLHVFVVSDHISLLQPEKGQQLHEAMGYFSKEYCLKGFCKRYKCIVINVQQQSAEKEKQEFYQGQTIDQKLEPSLDGLANNKETQRDCDMVIGLFGPARYNLKKYRGYDIDFFKDSFRSICFLKDRNYGLANTYLPLLFNGKTNVFEELPKVEDIKYENYIRHK